MPIHQEDENGTRRPRTPAASVVIALAALVIAATVGAGITPRSVLAETPGASPSAEPGASPTPTPTPIPVPTVVPPAAATGPTILGDTVTFYGRGYGHGVGMSQYGARGRALAGQDFVTILAHYYQGAVLSPIDPTTRIRVLVLAKWAATEAKPLVLYGRVGDWSIDGITAAFPRDARLRLIPAPATGAWRLVIDAVDGTPLYDAPAPADFTLRGVTAETRLQLWS
jgi:hypothetical protein